MEIHYIIGYVLAILVGISLGLIGSGGSILSVPILVYVMNIEPLLATAYSLFVVGTTALVGGIQKAREKLVDYKKVLLFGIPTILSVFITRKFILPSIPDVIYISHNFYFSKSILIMIVFAIVMFFASIRMIRPLKNAVVDNDETLNYPKIVLQGIFIGLIAGFVGAGGGFLIIPALLLLAKTPMKMAIGTSLFIVASQSLIGFLGDLQIHKNMDWKLLLTFSGLSIIGFFIGNGLSKKISGEKLKTGFGYFVLAMAIYILIKEVVLS